ncbi:protein-export membrane protein SecD [Candidatus Giovannonibacteria bacterium RIFCSPLOWO2_02_FULL_43_11b]|nr:MAG: protein-export membrane protein SecD [Candidatus Giovannonibacteria bacterium RIFCSPHIGHO2_02_FULL_43_32]OGF90337.1 MAG: protein-export membrane protein SecD [Candidatus Giovannonibacteria bacterium RIFCSPLOWO2_02_FULL_43_11b]OGF92198.1 MAG: protein-export membrane protein SecD [Candidatus Giovannonibacteria bacterium RIFCSPLOWO2_12_FULL_43_11c]
MWKSRILAALFIILGILAGYFDIAGHFAFTPDFLKREFSLGPDLQGGISLEYKADTSSIPDSERSEAMAGLRDIIENRVNLFGVSEPIIQVKKRGDEDRLIVELAGVFDVNNAIKIIGETPYLEFQTLKTGVTIEDLQKKQDAQDFVGVLGSFEPTKLTGRFLQKALLEYNQTTLESTVGLEFNNEGRDLFAKITKENIGKPVAIFLDGIPISMPTVREEITQGQAVISGNFSREEARKFVRNLNSGALPVPISLIKEETLGAYLGADTLNRMLQAGFYGIIGVALFLIFFYRLPGLIAVIALLIYTSLALTLFKLIPIYLTAAGIAGFILSIGMAVDANILIFERTKEELRGGKSLAMAVEEGFSRAWLSIRDSNVSSLITSVILFYLGSQSVSGFALTLGLGIVLSMLSAITITRTFLRALEFSNKGQERKIMRTLYGAS